jgi:hypothetical protein
MEDNGNINVNTDYLEGTDDETGIVIRELIQDFISHICKHKNLVEELCIVPAKVYISERVRTFTRLSYGIIILIVSLQVLTLLVIWDVRKKIKRFIR